MTRTVTIIALLATFFVTIGASSLAVTEAGAAQAGSYCSGISDSLRAAGWVPASCR